MKRGLTQVKSVSKDLQEIWYINTHIRCQNPDQIRCDDAGESSDAVNDRHEGACEIGTEIQRVDFHPWEEGPHEPHRHREQSNHCKLVITRVGGQDDTDGWSDGSWKKGVIKIIGMLT